MDQFNQGIRREKAFSSKRSRAGYLGRMTSLFNQIEQAMANSDDVKLVEKLKDDLHRAYEGFVTANKDFIKFTDNDADIESAILLYENQTKGKCEFDEYYEDWISKLQQESTPKENQIDEILNKKGNSKTCSRHSSCASNKSEKIKELKVKQSAAKIKASHLKTFQELEQQQLLLEQRRRMLEVQSEIDQVEAERKIWEEEGIVDNAQRKLRFEESREVNPFATTNFNSVSDGLTSNQHVFATPKDEKTSTQDKLSKFDQPTFNHRQKGFELSAPSKFTSTRQSVKKFHSDISIAPKFNNSSTKFNPAANVTLQQSKEMSKLVELQESMVQCQQRLINQQQENHKFLQASTMMNRFNLPHTGMLMFDGNPLEFYTFFTYFDNYIEQNTSSDSERLTYLLQYCSGKAKEAIKCCASLDPSRGYKEARKILNRYFGDPYHIATAHVNQLTNGPAIKPYDSSALLDYSMELKSCVNTLTAIGYLSDVNSSDNLRRMLERLPFNLKTKWLSRTRSLRSMSVNPGLKELCDFVDEQAEEANDPVFGDILSIKPSKPDQATKRLPKKSAFQPTSRSATTMVTQTTRAQEPKQQHESQSKQETCPACNGCHTLHRCFKFKEMTNDERVEILKRDHICFNCFTKGHYAVGCAQPPACTVSNCKSRHQSIMHRSSPSTSSKDTSSKDKDHSQAEKSQPAHAQNNVIGAGSSEGSKVFLKVVPVKIKNQQGCYIETYALLDSGSDISLCDKQILSELQLPSTEKGYYLTTQEKRDSYRVGREASLIVESMDSTTTITLPKVWAVESLNISADSIPTLDDIVRWPHLQDVDVSLTPANRDVRLLIGCNVPDAFFVLDQRKGSPGEPYGVRTPFGWTVFGPNDPICRHQSSNVFFASACQSSTNQLYKDKDEELTVQLAKFWKSDFGDPLLNHNPGLSVDDTKALNIMEQSAELVDGHYQLALPWKYQPPYLPNNRILAEQRLMYLRKKLLADDEVFKKYSTTINSYLDNGYAVKIPEDDVQVSDKPVWYLPHHGVTHPLKPEKLRVVYDCAAKYRQTSLNDQLFQGPNLTNSLVGVLTRFREKPIAVVADIEAMYHQVLVHPKDQDALRFLWWPNDDLSMQPEEYKMCVHLFGATSSPSCASFSLRKTAEDNRNFYDDDVINSALKNFYVDDFLKSTKTVEEAKHIVRDMTELMAKGGFHLTKWLSNKREVLQEIPSSERAKSISSMNLDLDDFPSDRTLGVLWNVNEDTFTFKVTLKNKPITRRGILSVSSSIYDPLGFVAPVILPAKKLLQDLTRQKLD